MRVSCVMEISFPGKLRNSSPKPPTMLGGSVFVALLIENEPAGSRARDPWENVSYICCTKKNSLRNLQTRPRVLRIRIYSAMYSEWHGSIRCTVNNVLSHIEATPLNCIPVEYLLYQDFYLNK